MEEAILQDQTHCDIAIVGAGIAGASLAAKLANDAGVVLLEREAQPGYHATGRSAAMFMETYGTVQIQALTRASRAFYENPPDGFCATPLMNARGCMYIAGRHQRALLQQRYEAAIALSPNVELYGADDAVGQVPCLRPQAVAAGALFEPFARDLDVHAIHQGFLRQARADGAHLRCNAELVGARRDGNGWRLDFADASVLHARVLVNAAGAWADEVAALCGAARVGLQPCRRTAFTFAGPADMEFSGWPAVVGLDESFYFKPDAGQLLGSPANADPVAPQDVVAEELDVATGIYHIEQATTLSIRRPRHTWAGLRSFVRDGDLVVGWDQACPEFFWLAAQGGYGIQSAPGVAAMAAALLLRKPVPDEILRQGVCPDAMSPQRLR
ncbi:NAD(P)/FAD-dependent oxidoreductase [Candidimonas nitroreducens]|uniref:FAD-dependent oxidoreductase n=1 Tax=Candidimonas nitroreducens TaxID=683354 RepID=A0A225MHA2_9BURK|nr:FAD-dependent oxidoreductase [Candidimonas nitroreducens]OWT58309.1 FAD-dependent oxidoreductase [Candidimonas nitroreducens]